jgi:type III restriction enzyme
VVYRLTPAAAYRAGLVKRIEVASSEEVGHTNRPYIRLGSIKTQKRTFTASLIIHTLRKDGSIALEEISVKPGASLFIHSGGLSAYDGYVVDEINSALGHVSFANTERVTLSEGIGNQQNAIFEAQILYTIQQHIEKQKQLIGQGIKVLSLFFIDKVDNYADPEAGIIRKLFDQAWESLKTDFPDWKSLAHPSCKEATLDWRSLSPELARSAYFASRRTRTGETIYEDSRTGTSQKDREAYELIMKDKERLLSLDEPVAFIFSHSALREGWDNPNIFQICTLNQTASVTRKRQEIGRGMRLCVNHAGERVLDEQLNTLTVIANESYDTYVRQYQSEIDEDYRVEIEQRFGKAIGQLTSSERDRIQREYGDVLPPLPHDVRRRATVTFDEHFKSHPEFKSLWEHISQKTRYKVAIDTATLVENVLAALGDVRIQPPRIVITKAAVDLTFTNVFEAWQMSSAKTLVSLAGRYPLPNLIDVMSQMMERTSPPMRLTRRTLLEIIRRAPYPEDRIANPIDWATAAVRIIKFQMSEQLVNGIKYEKLDEWYDMNILDEGFQTWADRLHESQRSPYEATEPNRTAPYHAIPVDSTIERNFADQVDHRLDVRFCIKLPKRFTVETPIGRYNPDWAVVMRQQDASVEYQGSHQIYLIAETKGSDDETQLRFSHERMKIRCGREHFCRTLAVPYRVLKTADKLPLPSLIIDQGPCSHE